MVQFSKIIWPPLLIRKLKGDVFVNGYWRIVIGVVRNRGQQDVNGEKNHGEHGDTSEQIQDRAALASLS